VFKSLQKNSVAIQDGPLLLKRIDLAGAVAQFGQDGAGILP
jgi:hypothetical protein